MNKQSNKMGHISRILSTGVERLKESATQAINRDTPLERNLREATDNRNWGCPTTVLAEISRASSDYNDYFVIMKTIWDGINDRPSRWRRVFKSLALLEYLIKNGTERVLDEVREGLYRIRCLTDFHYTLDGKDYGNGVRDSARRICDLVNDSGVLKVEREKARVNREKIVGIDSHGERSGPYTSYMDSTFNRDNSRRSIDNFYSSGGRYDPYPNESRPDRHNLRSSSSIEENPMRIKSRSNTENNSKPLPSQSPIREESESESSDSAPSETKVVSPPVASSLLDFDAPPSVEKRDDLFANDEWGAFEVAKPVSGGGGFDPFSSAPSDPFSSTGPPLRLPSDLIFSNTPPVDILSTSSTPSGGGVVQGGSKHQQRSNFNHFAGMSANQFQTGVSGNQYQTGVSGNPYQTGVSGNQYQTGMSGNQYHTGVSTPRYPQTGLGTIGGQMGVPSGGQPNPFADIPATVPSVSMNQPQQNFSIWS